jgi:hypothetical protein
LPEPDDAGAKTRRTWRRRRRLACATAVLLVAYGVTFRRPLFQGNFGVVDPGRVYRSKQPHGWVEPLIRGRRIASVLNLRGGSLADTFYQEEVRVTHALGVDFYDLPMSATRRPTRGELLLLLDLFGRCRYPLLIHCKEGSDRTGLACALYLMAAGGEAPAEASKAFALGYGHVPLFGPARLHEPIEEYGRWLEARRLAHTPERLRAWVEREYRSDEPPGPFRPLRPGPREPQLSWPAPAGGGLNPR